MIREEALKTLKRHLWYLSDLTVPMALFLEKVDQDIRARLAVRILFLKKKKKNSKAQKLVKPKFPKIGHNTELYDLLTEDPGSYPPSSRWTTTGWSSLWTAMRTVRTTGLP